MAAATAPVGLGRGHHGTAALRQAYKDDQDRESLKPGRQETSKSGGDGVAAHMETAFDPNTTGPEEEKDAAARGQGGPDENPLEVSPANRDVSRPPDGQDEGGSQGGKPDKKRRSGPHKNA